MSPPEEDQISWDDAFGDLDARTLTRQERIEFVERQVEIAQRGRGWSVRGGGEEAELVWHDAARSFVDGLWVACVLCCHAVCEREVAGIIAISPGNLEDRLDRRWEAFGLGRLLTVAERENLLPQDAVGDLRKLADARKPYGHWRSVTHEESLMNRVARERDATGHMDYINMLERLVVRDATQAIITTAKLFFGSYVLGG